MARRPKPSFVNLQQCGQLNLARCTMCMNTNPQNLCIVFSQPLCTNSVSRNHSYAHTHLNVRAHTPQAHIKAKLGDKLNEHLCACMPACSFHGTAPHLRGVLGQCARARCTTPVSGARHKKDLLQGMPCRLHSCCCASPTPGKWRAAVACPRDHECQRATALAAAAFLVEAGDQVAVPVHVVNPGHMS